MLGERQRREALGTRGIGGRVADESALRIYTTPAVAGAGCCGSGESSWKLVVRSVEFLLVLGWPLIVGFRGT